MKKCLCFLLVVFYLVNAKAQCPTIKSTFTKTDATCFNTATGAITSVTPLAGQPPFEYKLKVSGVYGPSNSFLNIKAGNYHVIIKDANGCEASTKVIVISQPALITSSFTKTDVSCYNGSNGSITLNNVSNGTGPYTYAIRQTGPYSNSPSFAGLRANSGYKVYIKDAVSCIGQTPKISILQPSATATTSHTYIATCDSVNWNGTYRSTAGDYTFRTTSYIGCDSFAILHLTIKSKSSSDTNVKACNNYTWNGTNYTASGDYTYHTTGANGCDSAATVHLLISNLATSSDTTVVACDTYTWNGTAYTTSGDYTYNTTGEYGCDSAATVHLTIKNSSTSDTTAVVCGILKWHDVNYTTSGDHVYYTTNTVGCDSAITLHLTVNSPTVTTDTTALGCGFFKWHDSIYTNTGIYFFYFDNAGVCSAKRLHLTVRAPVIAAISQTDATCNGSANGTITIEQPTSGQSPFTYRVGVVGGFSVFNNPPVVTSNLRAGSYRVYVKDSYGCVGVFAPIDVNQPVKVKATGTVTNASCYGFADGKITLDNPVGVGPFKYRMYNQVSYTSFTAPYDVTGLKAGNYRLYIQDANGCVGTTGTLSVMQPVALATTYVVKAACATIMNSGEIDSIATTNGSSPYMYKIRPADSYISTTSFIGLKGNTSYRLYTQDANGCTVVSDKITVGEISCIRPVVKTNSKNQPDDGSSKLSIFPNPARSIFTVQLNNYQAGKAEIILTSESGLIIEKRSVVIFSTKNNIQFNMQSKAAGTYFIKVVTNDGVQISKIVVQ